MDEYGLILGKLVCDRLGLDPNRVARELEVEHTGTAVVITTRNVHFIPAADFAELQALAHARLAAGEARG